MNVETTEHLSTWLRAANLRYRKLGMPAKQRPIEAIKELVQEHSISGDYAGPAAKAVFEWFENETKLRSQTFGSLFTGAYFFDASFFPLAIPITFGSPKVDPFSSLTGMPELMIDDIREDPQEAASLVKHWRL